MLEKTELRWNEDLHPAADPQPGHAQELASTTPAPDRYSDFYNRGGPAGIMPPTPQPPDTISGPPEIDPLMMPPIWQGEEEHIDPINWPGLGPAAAATDPMPPIWQSQARLPRQSSGSYQLPSWLGGGR